MKARKKGSNDEWKDIAYVQLRDSYCLTSEDQIEFQHDTLSTELKTYEQINEETHWQDVRERAAIAAMQGILCSPIVEGVCPNPSQKHIAELAVMQANLLIELLKKK